MSMMGRTSTLGVTGLGSQIIQKLLPMLPIGTDVMGYQSSREVGISHDRYLFCGGIMYGKTIRDMSRDEINATYTVDFAEIAQSCDKILSANTKARICVVGSDSGERGSFDMAYAGAKAALHMYVRNKKLSSPDQQLVAVSPWIIGDAGMTTRRKDIRTLGRMAESHPKGRFVLSREVAALVHFLLYVDEGYISNTVISMDGGRHAFK